MPEDHFAGEVATSYDEGVAEMFDAAVVEPAVDVLVELAGAGRVLELGIGTGRIALPLAARGVEVHGIDLSADMVGMMRSKPGGQDIPVAIGDFATTTVDGGFALAYLVFNTIMNLTSQREQVACFRNAARHLTTGGTFVVEVSVPQLRMLPPGTTYHAFSVTSTHLGFDEYDVVNQGLVSHHYEVADGHVRVQSVPFRYVWPAELDLMAELAGMSLVHRWADWDRSPFTETSTKHVSVWRKS